MEQSCWNTWEDRGFLINPNPLYTLRGVDVPLAIDITDHIESLGDQLPALLHNGTIRATLDKLPVYDMRPLRLLENQFHIIEYLMMRYGYLASAYVYGDPQNPAKNLPPGIAIPLVQLSQMVERPPILSYTLYVLTNWRLDNPELGITVDNASLIQNFLGGVDENWFILIHMDIEARAAGALQGIRRATEFAQRGDILGVMVGLHDVANSIHAMMMTFNRMTEKCDTETYYQQVRPYLFGFNDVVYEGVTEFGGVPQTYRGQTGAQSAIIPALVAGLGLQHEQSALTHHLITMRDYMPKPHREFISLMTQNNLRGFVMQNRTHPHLREAYNTALGRLLDFRRLHFHFANVYIAQKIKNPVGTGGTVFMDWLKQLADETEAQFA